MDVQWETMKSWPELGLEHMRDSGVARITLNRPEKRNALTGTLVKAFFEALEMLREDDETKVIITRGAGPVYSAGLDLHFLRERSHGQLGHWDRPTVTIQLTEALLDQRDDASAAAVLPDPMTLAACAERLTALARPRLAALADRPDAWWLARTPFFDVSKNNSTQPWRSQRRTRLRSSRVASSTASRWRTSTPSRWRSR